MTELPGPGVTGGMGQSVRFPEDLSCQTAFLFMTRLSVLTPKTGSTSLKLNLATRSRFRAWRTLAARCRISCLTSPKTPPS